MAGRQLLAVLVMAIGGAAAGLAFVTLLSPNQERVAASPTPAVTPAATMTPEPRPANTVKPRTPLPTVTATPRPSPPPTAAPTATALGMPGIPPDLLPPMDDLDNDGLTDEEEAAAGTDPWQWDTDGGMESDGAELASGRDPLNRADDMPDPGCIPPDAAVFEDGVSSDEMVPVPELEALLPPEVNGHRLAVSSTAGLPRYFGFFNYFWDALVLCAGAEPDDLAHAMGSAVLDSGDDGFGWASLYVVFAVRIDGLSGVQLAEQHVSEMLRQGRGEIIAATRSIDERSYTVLSRGGAVSHAGEVMFWMVPMDFLDSGFYVGAMVDDDLVEATVRQLPRWQ